MQLEPANKYFRQQLQKLQHELPVIRSVRGDGLILAVELAVPGKQVVRQALEAGLLINCTQENVLRFLPPLIVERRHVDDLMAVLRPILVRLNSSAEAVKPEKNEVHA